MAPHFQRQPPHQVPLIPGTAPGQRVARDRPFHQPVLRFAQAIPDDTRIPNGTTIDFIPTMHPLLAVATIATSLLVPLTDPGPREYAWGYAGSLGKIVFLAVGGDAQQLFAAFQSAATSDPHVRVKNLVMANGAANRFDASHWIRDMDPSYDRVKTMALDPAGVTPFQVQAAWIDISKKSEGTFCPLSNGARIAAIRRSDCQVYIRDLSASRERRAARSVRRYTASRMLHDLAKTEQLRSEDVAPSAANTTCASAMIT